MQGMFTGRQVISVTLYNLKWMIGVEHSESSICSKDHVNNVVEDAASITSSKFYWNLSFA